MSVVRPPFVLTVTCTGSADEARKRPNCRSASLAIVGPAAKQGPADITRTDAKSMFRKAGAVEIITARASIEGQEQPQGGRAAVALFSAQHDQLDGLTVDHADERKAADPQ